MQGAKNNPSFDGGSILKNIYELYAKQNGLRLEYTLDRATKTFTYCFYDADGNEVPVKY